MTETIGRRIAELLDGLDAEQAADAVACGVVRWGLHRDESDTRAVLAYLNSEDGLLKETIRSA